MREIKFRYVYKNIQTGEIRRQVFTIEAIEQSMKSAWQPRMIEIIIARDLFIGLKDCKGQEIYEGDKVQFKYANQKELYTGEVRWCISGWEILTEHSGWFGSRYLERSEVIGNIYSNPIEGGE